MLADPLADVLPSLAVVTGWIALALVLGSLTLRRRTPGPSGAWAAALA